MLSFAATWINLENIQWNKVGTERKHHMFSVTCRRLIKWSHRSIT
jgi:hypothetical protein